MADPNFIHVYLHQCQPRSDQFTQSYLKFEPLVGSKPTTSGSASNSIVELEIVQLEAKSSPEQDIFS
jgi:hypothetical protein